MSQPSYSSAVGYIGENFFTMTFDVALDDGNPPLIGAFDIQVNGTGVTASAVSVNGADKTVTITISTYLLAGDIIDIVYADPTNGNDASAIQGTDGADADSFVHSTTVSIGRPGPSAPPTPTLDAASDTGMLGDGVTNDNTPTINGTSDANATVKLYDTDGTTLLGTTTADGAGNWSITSSKLSDANHTLKVTQTDGSSNTSPLSTGLTLSIDTIANAPTKISVKAGSDSGMIGDGISNAATPFINGSTEANSTVTLYDTDGTTVLGSAKADGAGTWSIQTSTLVEGKHTFTAKQTDVAGNTSVASSDFSYTMDTIGPTKMGFDSLSQTSTTVQQSSATNGSTVTKLVSSDLTSVTYGFAVGNGTIDADNGKFTVSGDSLVTAQNLTVGTYHVYMSATDAAGNAAYQVFTLNVTNGPSVSSVVRAASASSTVDTTATSVDYTVTFSQSVTGVDSNDFTLTPSGNASGTISNVSGSGSTYTVTVNTLAGDGTLRLDLNSSGTGIQNGSSDPIAAGYTSGETYTLDHTAPNAPTTPSMTAGTDTGASSSDAITSNVTPVFTGTSEANATIKLYDTDGTTLLGTATADGSGKWSVTSSTLSEGDHTVTVKAFDAAGNMSSASSGKTATIDTTAPGAPATPVLSPGSDSGVSGDFLTNLTTPVITGSSEAGAKIKLYDTDGTTLLGTTTADGSGKWSITSSTLASGSHTLTVKQTDPAGNVSKASSGLTLDIDTSTPTTPAAPDLTDDSDTGISNSDNLTGDSTPTFKGTGTVGNTVKLYDTDGTTVLASGVVDGSGNWNLTSSKLSNGDHTLTVKQFNPAGTASSASSGLKVDIEATPPTATIVVSPTAVGAGQTADVTFTFSEAVTGFDSKDLMVGNGTISNLTTKDSGVTWTATYTANANVRELSNVITLDNSGVTTVPGTPGDGTTDSNKYQVDTQRPTGTVTVEQGELKAGQTSLVTISFSEAVGGFDNSDLTVENGTLSKVSSSDGGKTWTATLTPTADVSDSTNVITLNQAGVFDDFANDGSGTASSNNYAINTKALPVPTISGASYDAATGTLTVAGTDLPALTGAANDIDAGKFTISGQGGGTYTLKSTASVDISSATGFTLVLSAADKAAVDALLNKNGASATDNAVYNLAAGEDWAAGAPAAVVVADISGNPITVSGVTTKATPITATLSINDKSVTIGETALVNINFNQPVTGFDLGDISVPNGTLSNLTSIDGGASWTATFTPAANAQTDSNTLTLNLTGVADKSGTAGTGSASSASFAVDTQRPTGTVQVSGALTEGKTGTVTISFSEAVTGFDLTDLTVPSGTLSNLASNDGGKTWTATLTPPANTSAANNAITLNMGGVSDAAGNSGTGSSTSNNYVVDTTPTGNTDTSAPAFGSAAINGSSLVLSFSDANLLDAVNGPAATQFSVLVNGSLRTVSGVSVNGAAHTVTLTLASPVIAGDTVSVGYTDPTAGNDANAIQDAAGNDVASFSGASVTNNTPVTQPVDRTPPTASLSLSSGDLRAGQTATLTVNFSEAVTGFGLEDLKAGNATLSNLVAVDSRTYTVLLTPNANVSATSNSVSLNVAGVSDLAGNAGVGTTNSGSYAVNTAPTLSGTISLASGTLRAGQTTTVNISFSEPVTGLDTGDFTVGSGAISGLTSSDNGRNWQATFTPAADTSTSSNSIVLNLAGVTDSTGHAGVGSVQSGSYAVLTQSLNLAISSNVSVVGGGSSAQITFSFNRAPVGFTLEDISAAGGTMSNLVATSDPKVYTALFTPTGGASNGNAVINVGPGTYSDAAGNTGTGASLAGLFIDTVAPGFSVAGSSPADDATSVAINPTVLLNFSEPLSAAASQLSGVTLRASSSGLSVPATVSIDAQGHLVITPTQALNFSSGYSVQWTEGALKDAAGNAVAANTNSTTYNFTTVADPNTTVVQVPVDGAVVETRTTENPNGSTTTTISVPPVTNTRTDDPSSPNSTLADIPLGKDAQGHTTISASLPAGVGLTSTTGQGTTLGDQLSQGVQSHNVISADLNFLNDGITDVLRTRLPNVTADFQDITFTGSFEGLVQPIYIDGYVDTSNVITRTQYIVLDVGSNTVNNSSIVINNVEYVFLIGSASLTGGEGDNVVYANSAAQKIIQGPGDDELHGGGGDDVVGSKGGNDKLYGDDGNDLIVGGIDNDMLYGGAGNDILQGGMSDAGTWHFMLNKSQQIVSSFTTADADFGGPASSDHIGPWTAPGAAPDSDDRLAFTYQNAARLETVALLYQASMDRLPTLNELNFAISTNLTDHQFADVAYQRYAAAHSLPAGTEAQVKALITDVLGATAVSDSLVTTGVNYINGGGNWADALLYLARDARNKAAITDAQGNLSLTQTYISSELGWAAQSGDDKLYGGPGIDRLVGGTGSDLLDGGEGTDTAVFTGNVRDYHFHKVTVNGVAQILMSTPYNADVDTLISIERWEIGSKTYVASDALAGLADNVDKPLADYLVELVGQASPSAADAATGW